MAKKNKSSRIIFEPLGEKWVKTKECWYPNYEDNLVRIRFSYHNDIKQYHISAWGADDFGLERWEFVDLAEAEDVYKSITDFITQEELLILFNFIHC